jgi:phage tail sheath gpL-like
VTITGTATKAGEVALYVDGKRYATPIAVGDDEDAVSKALVALVNADSNAAVTAADDTLFFTLTANNLGVGAGDTDVRFSYNANEAFPAGLSGAAVTVAGTGDVTSTDFTDAIGANWYQVISGPYADATFLTGIQTWLTAQADVLVMKDSFYFTGIRGDKASLIAFAADSGRNNQFVNLLDCNAIPGTIGKRAAAVAGATIQSVLNTDVAVPFHRMKLAGELTLASEDVRDIVPDRNELANGGISTFTENNGVQTEATVTMYLENDAGGNDISYRQQNTLWQLLYARYTFRQDVLLKYPRAKLMTNTAKVRSLSQTISPVKGKAFAIAWFRRLESEGILENIEQFKRDVKCIRSTEDPNRLIWYLPADLVNQFIVGSADLAFILEGVN